MSNAAHDTAVRGYGTVRVAARRLLLHLRRHRVHDGLRTRIPVAGYLIRLDDDRLVLVDTGMSRLHVGDPDLTWRGTPNAEILSVAMRPEDSLLIRLAQLGLHPHDIDYVINTHLHFDHAGNNDRSTSSPRTTPAVPISTGTCRHCATSCSTASRNCSMVSVYSPRPGTPQDTSR